MSEHNPYPGGPLGGPPFPPPMGMPGPGMGPLSGGPVPPQPAAGTKGAKGKGKGKGKGEGEDGAPTKRSLKRNKVYALVLAILAALLALVALSKHSSQTYVVEVKVDVPALQMLAPSQLQAVALPKSAIAANTFTGTTAAEALSAANKAISGQSAQYPLFAGQQLIPAQFAKEVSLPNLTGSQRLMSIRADVAAAVDGTIRAGDRVDIIVVDKDQNVAGVVLTNVAVVAVQAGATTFQNAQAAQSSDTSKTATQLLPNDPIPGTYVVLVDQNQTTRLAAADELGDRVYLTLSGQNASNNPNTAPADLLQTVCGTNNPATPGGASAVPLPPGCKGA